jgi:hypothetical protein
MNKWEWETCDCEDVEGFSCACENKRCRLYKGRAIHWLGDHWRLECAFDHAVTLLQKSERCDQMGEMAKKERG